MGSGFRVWGSGFRRIWGRRDVGLGFEGVWVWGLGGLRGFCGQALNPEP